MLEQKIWRDVIVLISKLLMKLWLIVRTILLLQHLLFLLFVVGLLALQLIETVNQQTDPNLHC